MPLLAGEFARPSIEHGAACVSGDCCGVALWLPPGVRADGEALGRAFQETAKPEHMDDLWATLGAMAQWLPEGRIRCRERVAVGIENVPSASQRIW